MLGSSLAGCCGGGRDYGAVSQRVGYSAADVAAGGGANLGLGCGNPVELAALQPGEVSRRRRPLQQQHNNSAHRYY